VRTIYQRIVVGLDGSALAEQAMPHAAALAERMGAVLVLVQALTSRRELALSPAAYAAAIGLSPGEAATWSQVEEAEQRQAVAYLEAVAGPLRGQNQVVECRTPRADAADALIEHAGELDHSLIAMTTHGRGGLRRLVLGSVADAVVRRAPCPVLLARAGAAAEPPAPVYRSVLVTLDGSTVAEEVLPHAEAIARRFGARVTLLQAVQEAGDGEPDARPSTPRDGGRLEASPYLVRAVARLRDLGVEAHAERWAGGAAPVIARRAAELPADLVAMTTHGAGGLRRAVLGSVADQVVRLAQRPVLVVRAGAGRGSGVEQGPDR
jgi:nucleotide-binding universal stress UspA family protein